MTMHNLVTPMELFEPIQNLDGIPAEKEVGYGDPDSSAVIFCGSVMKGLV